MRALRLASLLPLGIAILAAGGCLPDDTGAVLLDFSQRSADVSPALATYSSSSAAASFAPDGSVRLTATSNQGVLTLALPGPLTVGATLALPPDEERVDFAFGTAAWSNQGGTIVVLSTDPVIIRLVGVPMSARSGGAAGSFVFDGGGTFRRAATGL